MYKLVEIVFRLLVFLLCIATSQASNPEVLDVLDHSPTTSEPSVTTTALWGAILPPPLNTSSSTAGKNEASASAVCVSRNKNEVLDIIYFTMRVVVGVLAVLGNFLILLSVIRFKNLKKASAYYLCNLAIADLVMGLISASFPLRLHYIRTVAGVGEVNYALYNFAIYHCLLSLLIVARDRYIFIIHPLTYEMSWSVTHPKIIITVSLLLSATLAGVMTCIVMYKGEKFILVNLWDIGYFTVIILSVAFLYTRIFLSAYKQLKRDRQATRGETISKTDMLRQMKVVRGYVFIVAMFTFTFIYVYLLISIRNYSNLCVISETSQTIFYAFYYFGVTAMNGNSVWNPCIYAYCHSHFRFAFKKNIVDIVTCCRVQMEVKKKTPNYLPENEYLYQKRCQKEKEVALANNDIPIHKTTHDEVEKTVSYRAEDNQIVVTGVESNGGLSGSIPWVDGSDA